MNVAFENGITMVFGQLNQLGKKDVTGMSPGYYQAFELLLPQFKTIGYIDSFVIEDGVTIEWGSLAGFRDRYPTEKEGNPHGKVQADLGSCLVTFCSAYDAATVDCEPGSWLKTDYKLCARDILEIFKRFQMIEDYVLYPKMSVTIMSPEVFMTPKQLEKYQALQSGNDAASAISPQRLEVAEKRLPVKDRFLALLEKLSAEGRLFHLDDSPESVINVASGQRIFTEKEADEIGDLVEEVKRVLGDDLMWDLAGPVFNPSSADDGLGGGPGV